MKVLALFTVCALAMGFVACGGDGTSGGMTCEVTRGETTVKVVSEVSGEGGYFVTVTDQGDHVLIESEYRYVNAAEAEAACAEQQQNASSWRDGSVTAKCSGKSVFVTEYDEGSLDSHQRSFENMCADMLSGKYDDDEDDDDEDFDY